MARPRKAKPQRGRSAARPTGESAVLYARVSTPEQEREGFSIDAQVKLIRDYAGAGSLEIREEFVDVETAKRSGRTQFEAMLRYLKSHPSVRHLLVEKTDRLYRNLKDWVTLDEFDVRIHLVKEGTVLSNDSRSSEKFMHGIKVLMAKNYIDNLSEETRKGMQEKAQQGIWPSMAPIGYANIVGPAGKKIIVPDPQCASLVTRLFEWFESGDYSLKLVTEKARKAGLRYRRTGRPIGISTVNQILRSRIYTGSFEWNGRVYQGSHQPLVSQETWTSVQEVLDGRSTSNVRASPLRFAYTGLINCGHCGCAVVAQMQKAKYIYYRCSHYKQQCPDRFIREETLSALFSEELKQLRIDDEIFGLIGRAVRESHEDESRERLEFVSRLRDECDRLQERLDALYIDHLDGRITSDMHDRMAATWREERERCQRQIDSLHSAEDGLIDDGIALLDLARQLHKSFTLQPAEMKSSAINLLLSNCTLAGGKLKVEFRQPFDLLTEMSESELASGSHGDPEKRGHTGWLPE